MSDSIAPKLSAIEKMFSDSKNLTPVLISPCNSKEIMPPNPVICFFAIACPG